jgi:hypothetical protein
MSNFNMQNDQQENNEPTTPTGNFSNFSTQETPSEQIIQEKIINNQINQNFQNNNQQPTQKANYYQNDSNKKIIDFFIGFFGTMAFWIISAIVFSLINLFVNTIIDSDIIDFISAMLIFIMTFIQFLPLLFTIIGIVYFFKKGRRFIAIGILSTIILPLLLFGACIIMLTGFGAF